ncbi:MAG: glycosyltransferase family 4 protein [Candidatus Promineifilaceae bacterium]
MSKHILMLLENNSYPQAGRARREATALIEAGYRVTVIAPTTGDTPHRDRINGVDVLRYQRPRQGKGLLGYLWQYGYTLIMHTMLAWLVLFRTGFDVIHAHNPPDVLVLVALPFKRLLGKKFVFDHHNLALEMYDSCANGKPNKHVQRWLLYFEKLSCQVADRIITTNQSYKEIVMKRSNVSEKQITIVRNGPEPERIRPVAPDPQLRAKSPNLLGYVGKMDMHNGVDHLLFALSHLKHDLGRTDFYAVLIGAGDEWDQLRALAKRLDIAELVWFTGRVSDEALVRYLSTVDVCVGPDPYNAFNDRSTRIKITEFMTLGKPIVAFALTEHQVTAQESAVYVPGNDIQAFARALSDLFDDPEARELMGRFGRKRAETTLTWPNSVPPLLNLYADLFGRKPITERQKLALSRKYAQQHAKASSQ